MRDWSFFAWILAGIGVLLKGEKNVQGSFGGGSSGCKDWVYADVGLDRQEGGC
jgi:hypothetical protein